MSTGFRVASFAAPLTEENINRNGYEDDNIAASDDEEYGPPPTTGVYRGNEDWRRSPEEDNKQAHWLELSTGNLDIDLIGWGFLGQSIVIQ